jgi:PAS domain S-box-containing protein
MEPTSDHEPDPRADPRGGAGGATFLQLLDVLPAAAYTCDADGLITYFNRRAVELWGREPRVGDPADRFCGSFKLFSADGVPIAHTACWMALALRDGREYNGHEIQIERPDGTRRTALAHANPITDAAGRAAGAVNVLVDVTDRAQADVTRSLLAAIVESSEDAIVSKTLDGVITSWNGGAERLFGYPAAEAVGRSITLVIPPDRLDEERQILERLRRGERVEHYETVRVTKAGRPIDLSLTISPVRDATGRIVGASKVARDISAQKRAEAELREADRRKSEFLAVLAHELRNPLAPLRTGLEVIRRAAHDLTATEQVRGMMERQLGHLVRLVDDLLDLSRITKGKIELRRDRVDLAAAVRDAVEASRPVLDERGHELALALPPGPVWVDGDRTRLAQVFANLLNNSAKYTPPGGRVRITAERQGSDAVVTVADDGAGIPADVLPRVFEMFTQADRPMERAQGGLGIGLSLVKGLVEMHGGSVEAHSDGPGKGSTFVVRLTALLAPPPPADAPDDAAPARSGGRSHRVLVVDDNEDGANSLALLLEIQGYVTRTAHDGLAAVDATAAFRPDVVLLDIGLPKLNGYDACRRIRALPGGDGVVLIALTGWGQDEDKARSKEAGFNFHLVKPVDPAALDKLLAGLLLTPA